MNAVLQCPQFHVYDDVLSEERLRPVWTFVQLETFVRVHQELWQTAVLYRDRAARVEAERARRRCSISAFFHLPGT